MISIYLVINDNHYNIKFNIIKYISNISAGFDLDSLDETEEEIFHTPVRQPIIPAQPLASIENSADSTIPTKNCESAPETKPSDSTEPTIPAAKSETAEDKRTQLRKSSRVKKSPVLYPDSEKPIKRE